MPRSYRWVILAVCTLAFVEVHVHRLAFSPLIPTFVAELGITYTTAGTIQTAYFWTYTLFQVPVGVLTDRWGARRVMLVFLSLLGLGTVLFAASGTYPESVGARALIGAGAAAIWVPGMRLITEWFPPDERGRATGVFSAGGGVGGTLALVGVPWLADRWGWRLAYGATALPVLALLPLIVVFVRAHHSEGGGARGATAGALGRVLATPAIWPYNLTVLLAYGAYFSMVTFLPAFFVERLRVSAAEAGLLTSLLTAGTIVSWPLAGYVSDRLGRPKAVYLASEVANVAACAAFALVGPGARLRRRGGGRGCDWARRGRHGHTVRHGDGDVPAGARGDRDGRPQRLLLRGRHVPPRHPRPCRRRDRQLFRRLPRRRRRPGRRADRRLLRARARSDASRRLKGRLP